VGKVVIQRDDGGLDCFVARAPRNDEHEAQYDLFCYHSKQHRAVILVRREKEVGQQNDFSCKIKTISNIFLADNMYHFNSVK